MGAPTRPVCHGGAQASLTQSCSPRRNWGFKVLSVGVVNDLVLTEQFLWKWKLQIMAQILLKNLAKTPVWWPAFTKSYLYTLNTPRSITRVNKNGVIVGASSRTTPSLYLSFKSGIRHHHRRILEFLFVTLCPQHCKKTCPRKTRSDKNQCVTLVATATRSLRGCEFSWCVDGSYRLCPYRVAGCLPLNAVFGAT